MVLYVQYGVTPWLGILLGMVFAALVAIAIGIPMLRLSGHYFAIATLLIGISFQVVFQRWEMVGAASGLWIPLTEESSWLALQFHDSKAPYYYVFLAFFAVTYLLVWRLNNSKIGFRLSRHCSTGSRIAGKDCSTSRSPTIPADAHCERVAREAARETAVFWSKLRPAFGDRHRGEER